MRKYLIIAPNWVGDMVMSQSLYRYLKNLYPDCVIDIAAPKHCCDLVQFMPEINKALALDFKHGEFGLTARFKKAKTFRKQGYTHAIVLPNSWKSALIPFFAKIKKRTGWHGEARFVLLNDRRKLDKQQYPLMIQRFNALAINKNQNLPYQLPFPHFIVDQAQQKRTLDKFQLQTYSPFVALCPGAEFGPAKKWPTKYYAQVAKFLLMQGYQVLLMGGAKDQETTKEITQICQEHQNLYDMAGKTTLPEAVYLLSCCIHVISNDSGLMHIACALDIPTVVIYGSTSDQFTPPLSNKASSLYLDGLNCRPCFKRQCPLGHMDCMNKLTPETVIAHFVQRQSRPEA
ncbi:lipopolysaccharide heptosyltransferase II [Facilibium subflavum]|uniref:lipopolysaccharide heptosyltransferase II n=1 Tax=Facilibium subflavum TaxID=2219058 RepID=UPI000E647C2D|nr:lipopolysaccharide heptosyltransferase II [Facilibium subflavum]